MTITGSTVHLFSYSMTTTITTIPYNSNYKLLNLEFFLYVLCIVLSFKHTHTHTANASFDVINVFRYSKHVLHHTCDLCRSQKSKKYWKLLSFMDPILEWNWIEWEKSIKCLCGCVLKCSKFKSYPRILFKVRYTCPFVMQMIIINPISFR